MESQYDIVQASQSEPITVVVGQGEDQYEEVKIPRALVGRTSHHLAKMIEETEGKPFALLLNPHMAVHKANNVI